MPTTVLYHKRIKKARKTLQNKEKNKNDLRTSGKLGSLFSLLYHPF
jgi:hypothetical protein